MSELRELYQETILDHNRSPRNFHAMDDATSSVEGYNPLCGDHYTVFVKIRDNVIQEVSFTGAGCAISKASASVMTQVLKGRSGEDALQIFQEFHRVVRGGIATEEELERLGKLAAFSGVSEFPARVKCASLAWHTLKAALEARNETVTTE